MWFWCWFIHSCGRNKIITMYIINGINSEIAQTILPKILKNNKIIGFYRTKYRGLKNQKLKVFKFNLKDKKKLQALVNNNNLIYLNFAAVRDNQLFVNSKVNDFKTAIDNNVISSLKILKILIPEMIKKKFGRIIFISSSTAENGSIGNIGYAASKSSLNGISNTLAKEYSRFNITSNIINLGYFNSKLWDSLDIKVKKNLLKQTLSKKVGDTRVVLETIKLITKNNFINMSKINVDGGNLLK